LENAKARAKQSKSNLAPLSVAAFVCKVRI
jgi:hypothetical protein